MVACMLSGSRACLHPPCISSQTSSGRAAPARAPRATTGAAATPTLCSMWPYVGLPSARPAQFSVSAFSALTRCIVGSGPSQRVVTLSAADLGVEALVTGWLPAGTGSEHRPLMLPVQFGKPRFVLAAPRRKTAGLTRCRAACAPTATRQATSIWTVTRTRSLRCGLRTARPPSGFSATSRARMASAASSTTRSRDTERMSRHRVHTQRVDAECPALACMCTEGVRWMWPRRASTNCTACRAASSPRLWTFTKTYERASHRQRLERELLQQTFGCVDCVAETFCRAIWMCSCRRARPPTRHWMRSCSSTTIRRTPSS